MIDLVRYTQLCHSLETRRPLQEAQGIIRELQRLEHAALRMGLLYVNDGRGSYMLARLPLHKWMTYLRLCEENDLAYVRLIETEITTLLREIQESSKKRSALIRDDDSCDYDEEP